MPADVPKEAAAAMEDHKKAWAKADIKITASAL